MDRASQINFTTTPLPGHPVAPSAVATDESGRLGPEHAGDHTDLMRRMALAEVDEVERIPGTLTVLIPAYNEAGFIAETIRSVLAQTRPADQILVVDDGSKDNTGEIARSMGVAVIRPPRNCGAKATALNFALAHVTGEYTLAIDADTTLAPDAIEKLLPAMADGNVAAACGFVLPRKVETFWERGRYIEYLYAFTVYKPIQDYYDRPMIASGCFSVYRTAELIFQGGWSTRTVGEDMDLTWSMYEDGRAIRFVADAMCYPVEPHNYSFMSKQLRRWSSGFIQCVRTHWQSLLKVPYLRMMVAVALWDAVLAALAFFVLLPALAIFVSPWFLLGYLLDAPGVALPVLYKAHQRGEVKRALASLPAFFVLRLINFVFLLEAVWREFVSRKRMTVFEKGH